MGFGIYGLWFLMSDGCFERGVCVFFFPFLFLCLERSGFFLASAFFLHSGGHLAVVVFTSGILQVNLRILQNLFLSSAKDVNPSAAQWRSSAFRPSRG
jgi:hypothetical protein